VSAIGFWNFIRSQGITELLKKLHDPSFHGAYLTAEILSILSYDSYLKIQSLKSNKIHVYRQISSSYSSESLISSPITQNHHYAHLFARIQGTSSYTFLFLPRFNDTSSKLPSYFKKPPKMPKYTIRNLLACNCMSCWECCEVDSPTILGNILADTDLQCDAQKCLRDIYCRDPWGECEQHLKCPRCTKVVRQEETKSA
jgi:hypothetical protein